MLDLFAGTGNISFEFASRDCRSVTAVDENVKCTGFIKTFSEQLNFNNIKVIKSDVFNYLQKADEKFDVIFADPPYASENIEQIPKLIFKESSSLLNKDGWLILEHSKRNNFESHPNFYQHRNYGKVNFTIFIELS